MFEINQLARFKTAVILLSGLLTLGASGCKDSDLPALKGRFVGELVEGGNFAQVVAELPGFIASGKRRQLNFAVFATLGSARPGPIGVVVREDRTIQVLSRATPAPGASLVANGTCASGRYDDRPIQLCWTEKKIDLTIGEKSDARYMALHLVRSDVLPAAPGKDGPSRPYSLDELMGRARFLNYTVSQEAERVFQARQNIKVARGNLLPKLNLKAVVGIFTGDYLSVVGAALPFLFPSNWYRWKSSQALYQAEKSSYASLRGNEMSFVEGLFLLVLRDQKVAALLSEHIAWMRSVQEGLRHEEAAGALPTGVADYLGVSINTIERDRLGFARLYQEELGLLAHAAALPPSLAPTELTGIEFPTLTGVNPVDARDFFKDAQARSFELKTLQFLLQAARYEPGEIIFGFLDPEGAGGLGFGTAPAIRVSQSRQRELEKKIDETSSLIELRAMQVASEYNSAIEGYAIADGGYAATKRRVDWLIQQHLTGASELDENEFVDQLSDLQARALGLLADRITNAQSWLSANGKVNRLLLQGYYDGLDGGMPLGQAISSVDGRRGN